MDRARAGLEGFLKEAEHLAVSAERWGGQRRLLVRDHSARPGGASLQGLGAEGTLTEVYTGPRASSLGADVRLGEGSGPHDCSRRRRPARWRALCGAACGGAPEGVSLVVKGFPRFPGCNFVFEIADCPGCETAAREMGSTV